MNKKLLCDLLDRALTEEMGVAVKTNNPHQLSLQLHEVSRLLPEYKTLIITVPSTTKTVMIAKRTVELDEDV